MQSRAWTLPRQNYLLLKWPEGTLEVILEEGMAEVWGEELPLLTGVRLPGPGATTIYTH
jgi:hypothetical protein